MSDVEFDLESDQLLEAALVHASAGLDKLAMQTVKPIDRSAVEQAAQDLRRATEACWRLLAVLEKLDAG
jgi:hypothetical protein